jgi:hypothetical protein
MEESNPAVLVKAVGGTVRPELLSKLVKNKAYIYLLQNPGKVASVCKKNSACPGKYLCTFVHFIDDPDDEEAKQHRKGKTFKVILASTRELTEISSTRLVQNQAYRFLWKNPGRQGQECEGHPVGIDETTCRYVHLLSGPQFAEKKKTEREQEQLEEQRQVQAAIQREADEKAAADKQKNGGDDNNSNDDQKEEIAKILRDRHLYPPASNDCNVCFDDLSSSSSAAGQNQFLECKLGHRTCADCMTRYLLEVYGRQSITPGEIPQVYCLTKNCRFAATIATTTPTAAQSSSSSSTLPLHLIPPFKAGEIARCVDPDAFDVYLRLYARAVEARALSEVSMRLREIVNMDPAQAMAAARKLETMTIAKALKDTSGAFMCSVCKFGPILLSGCSNLISHHGQTSVRIDKKTKKEIKGTVDNGCPGCGHLHKSTTEMSSWDGIVRLDIIVSKKNDDDD